VALLDPVQDENNNSLGVVGITSRRYPKDPKPKMFCGLIKFSVLSFFLDFGTNIWSMELIALFLETLCPLGLLDLKWFL
jgi:hypothetical protein